MQNSGASRRGNAELCPSRNPDGEARDEAPMRPTFETPRKSAARLLRARSVKSPSPAKAGLQQLRLVGRDGIADGDAAGGDHLGVNAAFVVAEPPHQGSRNGEVARAGVGIDID